MTGPVTDPPGPTARWAVPPWLDNLAAWVWRLGLVALGAYVLLRAFWTLRLVTVPVLFALVLTALLWPMRRFLTGHRVPAAIASALVMIGLVATLAAVAWIVSVGIGDELTDSAVWEETRQRTEDWLVDGPADLTREQVAAYEEQATEAVTSGAISLGVDRARLAVEIIGASLLSAVLLFFFLKDGPQMWQFVGHRVRRGRRNAVDRAGRAAFRALGGYARGVAIAGTVDAIAVGIVLLVLGVPLAFPLALLTFLGAFLPIVGAAAVGALSTVVALVTVGPEAAVVLLIATIVIQQVEGDIVLPLAMGAQVRLHPAAVLVSLALGGALAGIVGAFVAVPLAAMASASISELRRSHRSDGPKPDHASRSKGGIEKR